MNNKKRNRRSRERFQVKNFPFTRRSNLPPLEEHTKEKKDEAIPVKNMTQFTDKTLFIVIFLVVFHIGLDIRSARHHWQEREGQPSDEIVTVVEQYGQRCVGLEEDGDLDRMLSEYDLVYVLYTAKVASSTMKFFTSGCLQLEEVDNSIMNHMEEFLTRERQIPPFLGIRIPRSNAFVSIAQQSIKNSLIIYIHREETSRLKSAIRQVLTKTIPAPTIPEKKVLQNIRAKVGEIGVGGHGILTCDTYDAIEDNAANLVFLHYTQTDKMMKLLAKHHCPGYEQKHVNDGSDKDKKSVKLGDDSLMDLDEWIDAKLNLIEHTFNLKSEGSCQAKTRKMEHNLLSCPDEAYHYSSSDFFVPKDQNI